MTSQDITTVSAPDQAPESLPKQLIASECDEPVSPGLARALSQIYALIERRYWEKQARLRTERQEQATPECVS